MIRVATFNTASSIGTDHVSDWNRGLRLIAERHADAVGCEEVSVHEDFKPDIDMVQLAREYLKMNAIFARTTSRDTKGDYGIMALSPHKMEEVARIDLESPKGYEPRTCLVVRIHAETPFYLAVTHFSTRNEYPGAQEKRLAAICRITALAEERKLFPMVLCGDFNIGPDSPEIHLLKTRWNVCNDAAPLGSFTHHSGAMLDYIATFPMGAARLVNFCIGPQTEASDHKLVSADLEF